MSTGAYLLTGATLLSLFFCTLAEAKDVSCHLHAPADYTRFSKQPLVIPAVGNPSQCRQLNLQRFNARGRCHCTQDKINSTDSSDPAEFSPSTNRPELLP
jgi:hypothetical protein